MISTKTIYSDRDPLPSDKSPEKNINNGDLWVNTVQDETFYCKDAGIGEWRYVLEDDKAGLVNRPYNAGRLVTWLLGHRNTDLNSPSNYVQWQNIDTTIGNEDGASMLCLNPMIGLTPGTRVIKSARLKGVFLEAAYVSACYLEVWRKEGGNLVRVAQSEDAGPLTEEVAGHRHWNVEFTDFAVTLNDSYDYYYGIRLVRTDASVTVPYMARTADTDFEHDAIAVGIAASYDLSSNTIPFAGNGSTVEVISGQGWLVGVSIEYTSENLLEFERVNGDHNMAGKYLLPWTEDEPYWIRLQGIYLADGNDLTVHHSYIGQGNWVSTDAATAVLDMGATHQLTYHADVVALPDIDGYSQANCRYDFSWGVDFENSEIELFWQNTMREPNIHGHAVADAGARGTRHAQAAPIQHLQAVGTNAASTHGLRIGVSPKVLVGDSQTISNNGPNLRTVNTDALGGLLAASAKPSQYIMHGQAGAKAEELYEDMFANATPGDGDAIDMIGLGADWRICGPGLNDISHATTTTEAEAIAAATSTFEYINSIVQELVEAGEKVSVIGLPPYSSAVTDQYEALAIRLLNRWLLGMCLTYKIPFYNPWLDVVDRATINEDIPDFKSEYTSDGGTHYSAAGGSLVVPEAVASYERATIDLRFAWD